MLKGLILSYFLSITPSTHTPLFASQRSTFPYRGMIHCLQLCPCSGNELSQQQQQPTIPCETDTSHITHWHHQTTK